MALDDRLRRRVRGEWTVDSCFAVALPAASTTAAREALGRPHATQEGDALSEGEDQIEVGGSRPPIRERATRPL